MSRRVLLALALTVSCAILYIARPRVQPDQPPTSPARPDAAAGVTPVPRHAETIAAGPEPRREQARSIINRLPARFEKIDGSAPGGASFIARGYGRQLLLSCDRAVLARGGGAADVTMQIEGAGACRGSGERELPGRTNYLIGNDASQWRTDVRSYERASFAQVYPGIDLVYYGTGEHLEYDFIVAPGADASAIALNFAGTDRVEIDGDGALVLHAAGGELRQHAPTVYQEIEGERRRIEGRYVRRGEMGVGFELGAYDHSAPLTIDPVLVYSSYLGASETDSATDVALDSSGNIYMVGVTYSIGFPTMVPYQATNAGSLDVFIVKLDSSGSRLLFATYLGGSLEDSPGSLAVDEAGNIFVSGYSSSSDFPRVAGSYVYGTPDRSGVFVAKLTGDGRSLAYVARVALSPPFGSAALAVDAAGQAYVATTTISRELPVPNAAQRQCAGIGGAESLCPPDGYVFKLNTAGSALLYATYVGGTNFDSAFSIAIDRAGFAYVVGKADSTDFPIVNAFQSSLRGGTDAFLTVISPSGSTFVSSSYLGGSSYDYANDVALQSDGSVAIAGYTSSADFPDSNPVRPAEGSAFLTKVDATRRQLVFSTRLGSGGAGQDEANAVVIDEGGTIYVGGTSAGCRFPTRRAYPILTYKACRDHPFVASYSPAGALRHQMMVGGELDDYGTAMTLGPDKTIYLVGESRSTTLPAINALQSTNASTWAGIADSMLMKFAMALSVSRASPLRISIAGGDTVDVAGLNFMSGATVQFGGGPAVASTFVSPILIRAIAPAHAAGPVSIAVNNPDGESVTVPNAVYFGPCPFALSFADATYSLHGGVGSFALRTDEGGCGWTVTSDAPWLHVTSAVSGSGNTHVTFAVDPAGAALPSGRRTGTLSIAGLTFIVRQLANAGSVPNDFTGDGLADLATFRPADGRWTLNGQPDVTFGSAGDVAVPGDYDGDGLTDRAVYRRATGEWIIERLGTIRYGLPGDVPVPGDYDGDRVTDIAVFRPSAGRWFIPNHPAIDWGLPGDLAVPADYDGDGRTDIAVFRRATGEWWIAGRPAGVTWGSAGDIPVPADYDGDGRADIAVFRPAGGYWYVRDQFARSYGVAGDVPVPIDYDSDGRADLAVYRPSTALWFIDGRGAGLSIGTPGDVPAFFRLDAQLRATPDLDRDRLADVVLANGDNWTLVRSAGGRTLSPMGFGLGSNVHRVADFDGDGRADLVSYRPGTGMWYVLLSSTTYASYATMGPWGGVSLDMPVPADYDGDGRADIAVFRSASLSGEWYIRQSSDDAIVRRTFGSIGDIPMAEDVDGDGRADLIVWRRSVDGMSGNVFSRWYIRRSIDGGMTVLDWGTAGDVAAPADYDGDGRTDIAVFRPSTGYWWILLSSSGFTTYTGTDYGMSGDIPAPADYDGDGRADMAVFRPSTGQFFAAPAGLLFTASPGDTVVKHQ